MNRLTFLAPVVIALTLLTACANGAVKSSTPDDQDGPAAGALFLSRLQHMADTGDLSNPRDAKRILNLQLIASVKDTHPSDCSKGYGIRDSHATSLEQAEGGWYRPLASGAGHMDMPAAFINPAAQTGDAKLDYEIYHSVFCFDAVGMQDNMNAHLTFENLPSFACIGPADIRKGIPGAELHMATDGVYVVDYQGRVDDETGTTLRFIYRMGAPCAIDATLRQDKTMGLRYLRVSATYDTCSIDAKKKYCATHAHPTWADGHAQDDMLFYANKICGSRNALYLREPANGRKPPPPAPRAKAKGIPDWRNNPQAGPCDQV